MALSLSLSSSISCSIFFLDHGKGFLKNWQLGLGLDYVIVEISYQTNSGFYQETEKIVDVWGEHLSS